MSEVTKSARAVPKCKGCGQPRKGHVGPTGVTKCQNIVDKISEMVLCISTTFIHIDVFLMFVFLESGWGWSKKCDHLWPERVEEKWRKGEIEIFLINMKSMFLWFKTHEGVPARLEDPELDSLNIAKFVLGDVISAVLAEACHGTEKEDSDEVLRPGRKTDSNVESARAVPRCKGCGQPRKGHNGPTGLNKCLNIPNVISAKSNVTELITDPQELNKTEKVRYLFLQKIFTNVFYICTYLLCC